MRVPLYSGLFHSQRNVAIVEKFDINIQKQFAIFMFSSSVDERDLAIAKSHKNVKGYLIKPLKKQSLLELIDKLNE